MKKIFKLFGILFVIGNILCMASCDELFNLALGDDPQEEETPQGITYTQADGTINHEFYLSDNKGGWIYYTSTQTFKYGNHEDCIYQISFTPKNTAASRGTWILYTRERGSTGTLDQLYNGTFEGVNNGSIKTGGTVKLMIGNDVIDTLNIEFKNVTTSLGTTKETYACIVNVAASHAAIGAVDSK